MKKKVINKLLAGILCVAMLATSQDMAYVFAMPEDGQEVYSDVDMADVLEKGQESELKESDRISEEPEAGDVGAATYDNGWEQEKHTSFSLEEANSEAGIEIVTEGESERASYTLKYVVNVDRTVTIKGYSGTISGDLTIPDKINGYTVTRIANSVFKDCSGFTGNLTLPNSVKIIGDYAFYGCSGFIGDLTIPDSVTTIGKYAFCDCSGFTGDLTISDSVTTIPDSVTTIGDYAFYGCSGFTGNLTISDSVTTIGNYAFYGCSGFTGDLTIPDSVTTIGREAFRKCSGFNGSLTISEAVTTIEESAFSGCSGFSGNLIIPDSVTTIGESAFCFCSGFTGDLIIPKSVKTIRSSAFYDCKKLSSIRFLNSGCSIYSSVGTINPDSIKIYGYESSTAKSYAITYKRTFILLGTAGQIWVESLKAIKTKTEYTVGDILNTDDLTVTAYYRDGSSKAVTGFTTNASSLDMSTAGQKTLTVTYVENDITVEASIEINVKAKLHSLKAVKTKTEYTVGDTLNTDDLTVTAQYTDGNSKTVTGFTTNASSLDMSTAGQKTLTVTYVEDGITVEVSIEIHVKEKSGSISDILSYEVKGDTAVITGSKENAGGELVIPETIGGYKVTEIGDGAFEDGNRFTGNLVIPNGVTTIGDRAFSGCSGLTGNVIIPESVTKVGTDAFKGCSGISSIHFLNPECQIDDAEGTIPEGAVIYGYDNSTAEEYARKHTRPFVSLGASGGGENPPEQVQVKSLEAVKTKTEYTVGDTLNTDDLTVTAQYTDGSSKAVTGFTTNVSSLDMSTAGQKTLTVTYVENDIRVETSIKINVKAKLHSLEATKTRTEYTVGDTLNTDDLTVTAHYTDGSSNAVTGFTTNASSLDMSTAGQKTLTVTYVEDGVTAEASITIYVKETVVVTENCMITFDANGGVELSEASRTVGKGETPGELPSVKRDGYIFKGWYTEKEGGQEITEETLITEDTTLYAHWEEDSTKPGEPDDPIQPVYKVTFYLKGKDGSLDEYTCYTDIFSGSMIEAPSVPETEGCQFTGWYKDENCTVLWDFDTDVVTQDTILYAGWKQTDLGDKNHPEILPEDFPADGKIPDGIWIAGIEEYVYNGEAVTPQVRVYNRDRRLVKDRDYTVSYKNNKKAAEASGKKPPSIIVRGKGNYAGKVSQTFTIKKAELTEDCLVAASSYFAGSAYVPAVMLDGNILKAKTDYTLIYQDADGKKLKKCPVTEGSYSMHITGRGSCTGEIIFPYTIIKDGRISIAKGKAVVSSMAYGSKEPETGLIVNGETLKKGTDYTVKFNNIGKKGTATAVFTGIEKYTGVLKKTFKVKAASLPAGCVSIDASVVPYEKGGARPDVTVMVDGTKLNEGIDYTVAYKGNAKAGSVAQAAVKGKGNYSGVQNASFSVKEKDLAADGVKIYVSDVVAGSKKPAVTVYDTNGKKLSSGSDYKAEIDTTAHKVTITGGSNKLYTAGTPIIRAYQELEAGKVITSVLLNKKADNFPGKFQYAADGVELDQRWLTVKAGKNVLSVDDFEITGYINNASKGMATVIVQGKGEYGGTMALNFKIQSKSILSFFR